MGYLLKFENENLPKNFLNFSNLWYALYFTSKATKILIYNDKEQAPLVALNSKKQIATTVREFVYTESAHILIRCSKFLGTESLQVLCNDLAAQLLRPDSLYDQIVKQSNVYEEKFAKKMLQLLNAPEYKNTLLERDNSITTRLYNPEIVGKEYNIFDHLFLNNMYSWFRTYSLLGLASRFTELPYLAMNAVADSVYRKKKDKKVLETYPQIEQLPMDYWLNQPYLENNFLATVYRTIEI